MSILVSRCCRAAVSWKHSVSRKSWPSTFCLSVRNNNFTLHMIFRIKVMKVGSAHYVSAISEHMRDYTSPITMVARESEW